MSSESSPKKETRKKSESVSKHYSLIIFFVLSLFIVCSCFLGVLVYNCLERRFIPNSQGFCSDVTHFLHHWELRKSFSKNVSSMLLGYMTLIVNTFERLYAQFSNGPGGVFVEQIKEHVVEVYYRIIQHEQISNFFELVSNFSTDFFNLISHIAIKLAEIGFVYLKEVYQHGQTVIESAERYVHEYFNH